MENGKKANWGWGTGVAALVVALCIVVAFNVILRGINARWDMTQEKLYRLSDGTGNILRDLDEPVSLMFFFSRQSETPPMLTMWARRVEDLLDEYKRSGGAMIDVSTFDPRPDSEIEDMAHKYGLPGQPMGHGRLYMGLVISTGDRHEIIPFLDPRQEHLMEYNITRLIARVARPSKPVVGVISSLPVLGDQRPPYPMPNMPPPAPAWFAFRDLRKDYDVRDIALPTSRIDADVDALIVVHPKNLNDTTLFAIDQFLLAGGSLMVFVDPLSLVEAETSPAEPHMRMRPKSSDLPRLFEAWGVEYSSSKVVADLDAVSRLQGPDGIEESLVWLSLRQAHMNSDDILTAQIGSIMMPFAGAFKIDASADVEVTTLISSSETSALIDAMTAQFGGDGIRRQFVSGMTPLTLAARMHGRFRTAFPEGRPKAADKETEDIARLTGADPLKESAAPGTVILVASADMLFDPFCVREVNMFGHRGHTPMNDNLALFAGMVEQVAGGPALAGVRTRGRTDRPFTRVLDIERKAAERYMEEELLLQKKWETAQNRLRELEAGRGDDQRLILSRQQQGEIERFREQMAQTQRQLRLVRRKRNEDIERLGFKVKVANIALMPLLVALGGLSYWLVRRRRLRRS